MMTIYEKVLRVREIGEEMATIKQTLEAIRIIGATINVTTMNRCLMITNRLEERVNTLWDEFRLLAKEIDQFKKENGL